MIYSFANDQSATESKVFLDLQSKVRYHDQTNEEGFLGLAFHPKFKTNGEFFVFYTDKKAKLTNVVSRFRVSKDDPSRADPTTEVELLRIEHRFWNHDGGTLVFGPDGYLYIALGDGGAANDPENNGQNLGVILGKVLRIDVDHQADGKPYAIPPENPFVNRAGARPEIYAYGLRNVWRMAFDRETGKLWAADVGQICMRKSTSWNGARTTAGTFARDYILSVRAESAGDPISWNRFGSTTMRSANRLPAGQCIAAIGFPNFGARISTVITSR